MLRLSKLMEGLIRLGIGATSMVFLQRAILPVKQNVAFLLNGMLLASLVVGNES